MNMKKELIRQKEKSSAPRQGQAKHWLILLSSSTSCLCKLESGLVQG